jgi:hypothetical protein
MRRGVAAAGAVLVAGIIIERIRSRTGRDVRQADRPEAYCLTCKTRRQIDNPRAQLMSNLRTGIKGSCPVCGRGLFSVGNKAA